MAHLKDVRHHGAQTPSAPQDSVLCEIRGHGDGVLSGLNKERQAGNFLDFCVRVGTREISAHRVVLAASVPYIAGLFNVGGVQENEITLNELDGQAVVDIVEFVYTGRIKLTTENVQDMLVAADYLNISVVCKACCEFLKQKLDADCCVAVLHLAERLAQVELKEAAVAYIVAHFHQLVTTEHAERSLGIYTVPPDVLLTVLGSEKLCLYRSSKQDVMDPASQEAVLIQTVMRYVENNLEDHSKQLPELLMSVRLPVVSHTDLKALQTRLEDLQSRCTTEGVLFDSRCLEIVAEAVQTKVQEPTSETKGAWCRPRRYPGFEMMRSGRIYAAIDSPVRGRVVESFDDASVASGGYITGMRLWIRRWDGNKPVLGGICISYSNGEKAMHGGDNFKECHNFILSPDERIQQVDVNHGWMIDNLMFVTSMGNVFGPYGGPGGGRASERAPSEFGYLAYLKGFVLDEHGGSLAIYKLEFVWGHYNYKFELD